MSSATLLTKQEHAFQDSILQYISGRFVSIKPFDKKRYNRHLEFVLDTLIARMRAKSDFFDTIYMKQRVAGSYWDKLKVGEPVEFDKNFIMRLPSPFSKHLEVLRVHTQTEDPSPSFVYLKVGQKGLDELRNNGGQWGEYKRMLDWVDPYGFILTNKIRSWMESVLDKVLAAEKWEITGNNCRYKLKSCKAGPATTIKVQVLPHAFSEEEPHNISFDIDIVPAFEFSEALWPKHLRQCPDDCSSKNWRVVPKPIPASLEGPIHAPNTLWRVSFHEQEANLINGKYHLKAILKLIKKLRDVKELKMLSSYAIKTVFLWELDRDWQESLTTTFLGMMKRLIDFLESKKIPFYWEEDHNLLWALSDDQKKQLHRTFLNIYMKIMDGLQLRTDAFVIAKELLTDDEWKILEIDFNRKQ